MEQHGVKFTNDESKLRRSIETCGMAYLHAPLFNPAMKTVAPVRKALQVRTLFNLLGPLVNPCLPVFQLLGVADLPQMRLYTNTLQRLNIGFAVVNNLDGYDEISLTDEFKVMTNRYETIYRPSDLGFTISRKEELYGGRTPEEAASIFDNVLQNRATKSPDRLCSDKCFVRHTSPRATKANRRMRINGQRITGKRTGMEHIL